MKKGLLIFVAAATLIACKSTSGKAGEASGDSVATAQKEKALADSANFTTAVWVDSTFKDVGKVKKGQVVEIPFTIKNTGDKPLVIASVSPGCGCTVGEKPEKPILPGEEGKVVAKFNSAGQAEGSHNKNMTVHANTKPFTETVLNFKVEVVN
ncbi:DUF1573 domain-containing protein [Niabella drilacis]|uniref:DUF1573 domain-containing protein n=1 Tax=Niabella drilacis (strain DSM 25811 / CCM 8410 / CCUG 62505 / LMG 26954 / E90) TaxID=1285928 RepID=A0A1G6WBU0_NIADE|nr:DUF1573 domain-containing protein [Niabella drilacis]SDD63259.1 Protein of unknown function [Niabella drilacis]